MDQAQPATPDIGPDVRQDLQFVRAAVERGAHPEGPAIIYWIWGIVTLFGFALNDFAQQWDGLYWAIVGPVAGVVTWLMMRQILRRYGVSDRKEETREWLQWVAMAACIVLLVFDTSRGRIAGATLGQLILLIVGYTYFLTYVRRGDRVMLIAGLTMAAGFVVMTFATAYVWTIMGVSVFLALAGGSTIAELTRKRAHA